MEEPDKGSSDTVPVVFQATEDNPTIATEVKTDGKKGTTQRLKNRKATPRPVLKGPGNKRYSLTPSPNLKPEAKRAIGEAEGNKWSFAKKKGRNLLNDLDDADDKPDAVAEAASSNQEQSPAVEEDPLADESSDLALVVVPMFEQEEGCRNDTHNPARTTESPPETLPDKTVDEGVTRPYDLCDAPQGGTDSLADSSTFTNSGIETTTTGKVERNIGSKGEKGGPHSDLKISWSNSGTTHLPIMENDLHLDSVIAQPLQSAIPSPLSLQNSGNGEPEPKMATVQPARVMAPSVEFNAEFPPLPRGSTKSLTAKFEGWCKTGVQATTSGHTTEQGGSHDRRPLTTNHVHLSTNDMEIETSTMPEIITPNPLKPTTSADIVINGTTPNAANEPVVLNPDKIQRIGAASFSEGRPSLHFSSSDTAYLADKMGHAVVGKFSHSIPSTSQIQKLLGSIKFVRGFSWNYINAKHIILQFEDIADYAMMMSGPDGTPVWFVEHHPMRMFKWTPNFDSFFETPVAAIWCNVIALPIHLFEVSALYAVGSLLGKPIQLDPATANKTRLSFARLCVEIDISKYPPEEIVLDILGKETILKIKWDKIPLYCRDCRHVGHAASACYAFGKREVPAKNASRVHQNGNQNGNQGNWEQRQRQNYRMKGGKGAGNFESASFGKKSNAENVTQQNQGKKTMPQQEVGEASGSAMGPQPPTIADFIDADGFLKQGRKGKRGKQGTNGKSNLSRSNSADKIEELGSAKERSGKGAAISSSTTEQIRQGARGFLEQPGFLDKSLLQFAKPSYFSNLEGGSFETAHNTERYEMGMDLGAEGDQARNWDRPPDEESAKTQNTEVGSSTIQKDGGSTSTRGVTSP